MSPEASAQLLAQLRDIESAPPAPFWPPAPGWWIVATLLLVLALWLANRLLQRWRLRQRRARLEARLRALRAEHDPVLAPQDYLAAVNRLLKVAAIRTAEGSAAVALQGEDWVRFLAGEARADGHRSPALAPLASGPYQPQPAFDADALEAAAAQWLKRHG